MSLICTFALTCDACGKLITHKSLPVEAGVLHIPIEREQTAKQDFCEECEGIVAEAVREALEPIHAKRVSRRAS